MPEDSGGRGRLGRIEAGKKKGEKWDKEKECILEGSERDVQPMASSDWPPQKLSEVHLGNQHSSNVK